MELDPDLVLVIFLPPLLYSGAFFANLRDLRADLRTISLLAVGLVLATMVVVAVVAHEVVDGLSWPAAFTLGAIVGPTDPVAATAIARRLGVPRRQIAILEGEGLINDATALVAYQIGIGDGGVALLADGRRLGVPGRTRPAGSRWARGRLCRQPRSASGSTIR